MTVASRAGDRFAALSGGPLDGSVMRVAGGSSVIPVPGDNYETNRYVATADLTHISARVYRYHAAIDDMTDGETIVRGTD